MLSTLCVFMTAVGLGACVYYVTDFALYESLLLCSIVSSTAAPFFSILRSRSLPLKHNLRPTLELADSVKSELVEIRRGSCCPAFYRSAWVPSNDPNIDDSASRPVYHS